MADTVKSQASQAQSGPDAKRIITTFTGNFERKWLPVMAAKLPHWVTPDILTAIGVVASIGIGLFYILSGFNSVWLWAINILLVIHWFADSLDGTLARVRKIERPRYGFFIDHSADAIAALLICLGLGLSPHMDLRIALGLLLSYYLMMIYVLLRAYTLREFKIAFGRLGPTEIRIVLILANVVLWVQSVWFSSDRLITLFRVPIRLMDVIAIGAALSLAGIFVGTMIRSLRRLAELEPPGTPHSE
jgi:phosphatidylglycerophosphate synthase